MFEHRSLMMRANRLFGANLVEHNLLPIEALETANTQFLDTVGSPGANGLPRHLLHVLLYHTKSLTEEALVAHQVDELGLGLIDLRYFEPLEEFRLKYAGPAWATLSVPFDREDDVTLVASCYQLSPVVREFWEKELGGRLLWYVTSLDALSECVDLMRKSAPAPTA
jgi:hypothetical protein